MTLFTASNPAECVHLAARQSDKGRLAGEELGAQNAAFWGTGGISEENRDYGFAPAFLDSRTGNVYLSRFADGRVAPVHLLDGLPAEMVESRYPSGRVAAVSASVVAGFVRGGQFYTREQAASFMSALQESMVDYAALAH